MAAVAHIAEHDDCFERCLVRKFAIDFVIVVELAVESYCSIFVHRFVSY